MNASLDTVMVMFEKMKNNGFPVNENLKWGFYFVDSSQENLKNVFKELGGYDYILEGIEKTGNNEYQLHVSKVETLIPEKLHKRNIAFNELAEYCHVNSYDGWDVEKII